MAALADEVTRCEIEAGMLAKSEEFAASGNRVHLPPADLPADTRPADGDMAESSAGRLA